MRKEYYRQHREEILAKNRAWKKAHPEVLSEWEAKNRAKRTEQKRRWKDEHREDVQNTNKAYVKNHAEIFKNGNKKWRNKNPEKLIHYKTPGLIRAGVLVKAERCYFCDVTKNLVAHHQDYQKPTEVVWLCRSCHSKLHVLKQERRKVSLEFVEKYFEGGLG